LARRALAALQRFAMHGCARLRERANNKRKSDKALVRLDQAEAEVRAIRVEGFKIGKLGKDRLAEIDEWAFRLAKKFAPKENEKSVLG
jgi:hypothetical protein